MPHAAAGPVNPPAAENRRAARRSLFAWLTRSPFDFFFRYDFFISYRWSDGRAYAVRLRDELQARGFIVFLDSSDFAKGDNWRESGRRALARSSRLLLVASPEVLGSEPVRHEVEIFAGLGRRILPIDIAGTLVSGAGLAPWVALLPPEVLRFAEPGVDCLRTGPSKEVVDDIGRSFDLIRQQTRRVRLLTGTIAVLACLLVLAALLGVYAETKRRQAIAESEAKERQRLVAEGGRAAAILDDPAEWSVGLGIAAANAFAARNGHHPVPRGLHLALLRAVWAATPYRVVSRDVSPSAQAHFVGGGRVVALTDNEKLVVIDLRSGVTTPLPLRGVPPGARRVAASPDGGRVLVLGRTGGVGVWRIDGAPVRSIDAPDTPDDFIAAAAFAGNGRVFTASRSGSVRAWPLAGAGPGPGRLVSSVPQGIVAMAVAPRGDRIAIADDATPDPGLRLHDVDVDVASGRAVSLVVKGRVDRTTALAFSPDGSRVVSADEAGKVHLWDAQTGKLVAQTRVSDQPAAGVAFSADGRRVAIGGFDKSVHVWDTERHRTRTLLGHLGPVTSVAFAPDGDQLLSASEDGTIRLWSILRHPGVVVLDGRMDTVCGHATPARGDRIVLIGKGQQAQIFDTGTGEKIRDLGDPGARAVSAAFSPDGTRVVIASAGDGISVWDATTGARVSARGDLPRARSVAFVPAGDRVVFAGTNGVAGVWTVGGGVTMLDVPKKQSVYGIAMSQDGQQIATTGQGGGVQTWNAADGTARAQLGGNAIFGDSACFARDPDRLLTSGGDGIAYLWDLRRRGRLLTLAGHADFVKTATFSLDETLIYTASDDRSVRIWDATDGTQVGRLVLPGAAHDAIELPGHRFAVTTAEETWLGSTKLDDLLAAACEVVALGGIDRVAPAEAQQLAQDCAR